MILKSKNLQIALSSLCHNFLRSFLTIIGIVVGISAVISVLAMGEGHEAKIKEAINKMGASVFWIRPQYKFYDSPNERVNTLKNSLTFADYEKIKSRCSTVRWTAPIIFRHSRGSLNGKTFNFNLLATSPEYIKIKDLHLVYGRYLCDFDLVNLRNICVIVEDTELNLAVNDENYININGLQFKVVGIIKRNSAMGIPIRSKSIHIPITVANNMFFEKTVIQKIYCKARKHKLDKAMKQVKLLMKSRNYGKVNFKIQTPRDLYKKREELTNTATMVTAGIGMLSLFVGGIGIMNILLASVMERTREIGIRKAVGAKKKDILFQFIFESILFSVFGGIIGIIASLFITKILTTVINIPMIISFNAILIAVSFSIFVGIIFGIYPALKAAGLNPIEALRYE